jgi:hypothetical protein
MPRIGRSITSTLESISSIASTPAPSVSNASPAGFRPRKPVRMSGSNSEPLGVRKADLLPSVKEQIAEKEEQERYLNGAARRAEWKRRQDVS